MIDAGDLVREHIRHMPAYEPVLPLEILSIQLDLPVNKLVKLDANENPYGAIPAVREALSAMEYSHIYPDPESRSLRQALAEYHDIPMENLLAGAGVDELIDLLMRAVLEPGESLVNFPPTFGMYAFDGNINRGQVISVWRDQNFHINLSAVETAIQAGSPKLLFLATPNNPDGSIAPFEIIEKLLSLPLIVVLDEAYIEFAQRGSSMIQEVPKYENLVVLRTFSKWAGLAGLRVGYGAFPSSLVPHLWKIKQPYNVSVAAGEAALAALQNAAQLKEIGQLIVDERERLFDQLSAIPWLEPYRSQANFILCKVKGRAAQSIKAELASNGILVRYFNKPGLSDHIRITIGKPEHSNALLRVLNRL